MDDIGFRYRWSRRDGLPIHTPPHLRSPGEAGTSPDIPRDTSNSRPSRSPRNLPIEPLVARILNARGLADPADLDRFVNTSLKHLHDASLLPNIGRAVERIIASLRRGGPIVIYGDYDVDGITASAILYHTFRAAAPQADIRIHIPHRIDEGYGLNAHSLVELRRQGADLVVSVDCGITALEPAAAARACGLDLIITDHHNPPQPGDPLPDAFAIVHPRLPGSAYPFGHLCGAGVAFKVAWEFARAWCGSERVSDAYRVLLTECLAFAALGTIADIVPLHGENRVIAKYGLRMMKFTRFVGLNALISAAGLDDEGIDSEAVGFRLGPRLNAAGRMGHAREAAFLLTDATPGEAMAIARQLNIQNQDRRDTERQIFEQACAMAEQAGMTGADRRIIVLCHPDWHAGVVGIVASNLVERFGRPAILLHETADGASCRGSARSIPGYSIHAGLAAAATHLERFGGHDMAAGLSVARENLAAFIEAITAHANEHISVADLTPSLAIDCEAGLHELTATAVHQVLALGPFGAENPRPALLVRGLQVGADVKTMGSGGKHLSLAVFGEVESVAMAATEAAARGRGWTDPQGWSDRANEQAGAGAGMGAGASTDAGRADGMSPGREGSSGRSAMVARGDLGRGIGWRPARAGGSVTGSVSLERGPRASDTGPAAAERGPAMPERGVPGLRSNVVRRIVVPPRIRLVGWGMGEYADRLARGMRVDAIIQPKFNTFRGETKVEAELLDLRICEQ